MEFKKLELEEENNSRFTKLLKSKHFRTSSIMVLLGALAGFAYFYFTEGQHMDAMGYENILKSMLLGGFFGFFITNSPCARGRC